MTDPTDYQLSRTAIRRFIARNQIVTESAKAAVPSVVRQIVGRDYGGTWWSLPKSSSIYNLLQQLRDDQTLLVCRLVGGKVTYVDQKSWIPLAALSAHLPRGSLDRVVETHTASGAHVSGSVPLNEWLPADARAAAAALQPAAAVAQLEALVPGAARWLTNC